MTDNRKRRSPSDRMKLHALYDKKLKELEAMQAEVDEIGELVKQADRTAIHATAEMYNVTPEQLAELMKKVFGKPGGHVVPEPPVPAEGTSEKEANAVDDE